MTEAQSYYDGLIGQGHPPDSATSLTQQYFPDFSPSVGAPAPAPAPAMAAPVMVAPDPAPAPAPAMAVPVATQPVALVQPSGPTVIQTGAGGQTSTLLAYVLWFFLGWLGVHHLYIGRGIGIWLLSLITFQGLGLWWLIDLFLIPSSVSKRNQSSGQVVVVH
jgi:hypothetical protein